MATLFKVSYHSIQNRKKTSLLSHEAILLLTIALSCPVLSSHMYFQVQTVFHTVLRTFFSWLAYLFTYYYAR